MQNKTIDIKFSYWLWGAVLAAHVGALLVLFNVPLNDWLKIVGVLCVAFSGWRIAQRDIKQRIVALASHRDGTWSLKLVDGRECEATLLNDSYVSAYMMVLRFRLSNGRRRAVVLFPDTVSKETMRQLRIHLFLGVADYV